MIRKLFGVLVIGGTFLISACDSGGDDDDLEGELLPERFKAIFDPSNSVIPFPINLLLLGTLDGTLNIPVEDPSDISDPKVSLNALDGFSTIAPFSTTFNEEISDDPAVLNGAVRIYEVTVDPATRLVDEIVDVLVPGTHFIASRSSVDPQNRTLAILPLQPLQPQSTYLVGITRDFESATGVRPIQDTTYTFARFRESLVDDDGNSKIAALTNDQAQSLNALRPIFNAQDDALTDFLASNPTHPLIDLVEPPSNLVLAWNFPTQSVGAVLPVVRSLARDPDQNSAEDPVSSTIIGDVADSPLGAADIYIGTLDVPYYLTAPANKDDLTPLGTFWQAKNVFAGERNLTAANPLPQATSIETIPLMLSIPKLGAAPWPVIIFQHGITTNRANMLAIADAAAGAGFAVVAIDLPLHGVTGNETNGSENFYMAGLERTFDLDLATQDPATGSIQIMAPDNVTDTSGRHFINLSSLRTARDNLRQAVADLFTLTHALADMNYDGNPGGDFDITNIRFVGHSLGGIVGTSFLNNEPSVGAAVLAMPGGGVAKILDASATFGSEIAAGLEAAAQIRRGTPDYESFFAAAQTVIDTVDPINHAAGAAAGRSIMLFEVVGDNGANLPDQVIPNHVGTLALGFTDAPTGIVPSPTAGTDPFAGVTGLGLTRVTANTDLAPTGESAITNPWLRFTAGNHGSVLDPTENGLVTQVMQNAMASFLATNGAGFDVDLPPASPLPAPATNVLE